jgi:hypothetical protein
LLKFDNIRVLNNSSTIAVKVSRAGKCGRVIGIRLGVWQDIATTPSD